MLRSKWRSVPTAMTAAGSSSEFSRLQQEHAKAIQAAQETAKKWEQFKYDYEVLQVRLHTLPDRLTHDVMVPFGRFGFMRGHLYHTNEITVLLGDNWFAQRTAKQAIEIAERRKKCVTEMLDKEREVLEDLEARSSFVQELSAVAQENKDVFEIREEYDPIEEERRKNARREERERRRRTGVKVPPPRPAFPKKTVASVAGGEERGEGGSGREEGEGGSGREGGRSEDDRGSGQKLWRKLKQQEEGGGEVCKSTPIITFKHTETSVRPPIRSEALVYSSPGDIFRTRHRTSHRHAVDEQEAEREDGEKEGGGKEEQEEVLRRAVHWDPHLRSSQQLRDQAMDRLALPHHSEDTSPSLATAATTQHVPFTGRVLENQDTQHQQVSVRKVSKFKASRSIQHSDSTFTNH